MKKLLLTILAVFALHIAKAQILSFTLSSDSVSVNEALFITNTSNAYSSYLINFGECQVNDPDYICNDTLIDSLVSHKYHLFSDYTITLYGLDSNNVKIDSTSQSINVIPPQLPLSQSAACPCSDFVVNGDFENVTKAPTMQGQIDRAPPWIQQILGNTNMSPDLYLDDPSSTDPGCSVPVNRYGNISPIPASGTAYAGIHTFSNNYIGGQGFRNREYLVEKLACPLTEGLTYRVEMLVALAERTDFYSQNLGIYLGEWDMSKYSYAPNQTLLYNNSPINPQIVGNNINSQNWVWVSGTFTANANNIEGIYIGNFDTNDIVGQNVLTSGHPAPTNPTAYYYIDKVNIVPIVNVTLSPPVICPDGGTTDLTQYVTSPAGYTLSFSSSTSNTTANGIFANVVGNHVITITATDINGCQHTSTHTINVTDLTLDFSGLPSSICEGDYPTNLNNYASIMWGNTNVNNQTSILYSCSTSGVVAPGGVLHTTVVGTHTIYATTPYNGCWASDTFTINILPTPVASITGDSIICLGDTAVLTANANLSPVLYLWDNWMNTQSISVTPQTTTTYSVIVHASICSDTAYHTVYVSPPPTISINYGDIYCDGDSILIIPSHIDSNCHTFSWVDLDWNVVSTDSFALVKPGTYTVTVTDTITGCSSDTTFNTDDFMPSVNIQGDTIACYGDTVMLWDSLNTNYTYLWSTGSSDTAIYVTESGWYTLTTTDTITGCISTDSTYVWFDDIEPYAIFTEFVVDTICEGDTIRLSVLDSLTLSQHPPSNYTINWSNGATTNTTNVTGGTHWVTVTNPNGCTSSDTISIVQMNKPNLVLTSSISSIGCEDSVLVTASTNPYSSTASFAWSVYGTNSVPNPNPFHWGNNLWVYQSGPLVVNVSDSGCTTKDTIRVVFNDACCKIPQADIEIEVDHDGTLMTLAGGNPVQNKVIVIHDTLYIKKGITLENCEVFMGANAVIWYDPLGSFPSLTLDNTHIHACSDTMWQGVYVNSRNIIVKNGSIIEDAYEAIVMNLPGVANSNDAHFKISDSYLKNNLFSLVAYSDLEINNSSIKGSTISNDKKLLYNQYNGLYADSSFVGILLNNTRPLVIGDGSDPAYKNTIRDLDYGIIGNFTDFKVYNNHFENIYWDHSSAFNTAYPTGTACILAIGNQQLPVSIKVGNTSTANSNNTFIHFDRGIYAETVNSDIINNSFTQGQWTGVFTNLTKDRVTRVIENTFINTNIGVNIKFNDEGHCYIKENEFSTIPSLGNINSMQGVNAGNLDPNILNIFKVTNNCFNDVLFASVNLTNIYAPFIYRNDINSSKYGVYLKHCTYPHVNLNKIVGNYNSTSEGIKVSYCTKPRIMCNFIKYYQDAMHFDGQMQARLKRNTMVSSIRGVVIDNNGSIGQQGNKQNPWDNRWIGFGQIVNGNPIRPHLYTKGGSIGTSSRFFTRQSYPYDPTFSDEEFGSSLIPTPNYVNSAPAIVWCKDLPNCNSDGGGPTDDDLTIEAMTNDISLMEYVALTDTAFMLEPTLYNSQELLYRELKDSTEIMDSSLVLSNFYTNKNTEDMGRIERIKLKIANSLYTDAQAITDSILALYPYELNAKIVLDKILAPYLRGEDITKLTAGELDTIRAIAYLCPHTDGLIVYTARVICNLHDDYFIDYVNVCERSFSLIPQPKMAEDEIEGVNIYPNPAKEKVHFSSDKAGILLVSNNIGQIIGEYTIEDNIPLEIDVSQLNSGLYFCKFVDNENEITTKKLEIVR